MTERLRSTFDHHSEEYAADWAGAFAQLRASSSVAWSDAHGGFLVVSKFEDVRQVAQDPARFSSARREADMCGLTIPEFELKIPVIPEEMDPPDLAKYRKLVSTLLTPREVAALQPTIQAWTDLFIDRVIESGRIEFCADLIRAVPASLTLQWLGFDAADWKSYVEGAASVYEDGAEVGDATDDPHGDLAAMGARLASLHDRIVEIVSDRRANPQQDVISYIVAQQIDGEPVSDEMAHSMVELLILGGLDTTASVTGSALVYLSQHPEEKDRLRYDPDLLETATEEFLRYFPPAISHARTAVADTEVGGCPVHAGERVMIAWGSANRDPGVFQDPDNVDLARSPNPHASFGLGVHRCLGSHLARAVFKIMMTAILTRMPDFIVDEDAMELSFVTSTKSWASIPATFTPDRRVGAAIPHAPVV